MHAGSSFSGYDDTPGDNAAADAADPPAAGPEPSAAPGSPPAAAGPHVTAGEVMAPGTFLHFGEQTLTVKDHRGTSLGKRERKRNV